MDLPKLVAEYIETNSLLEPGEKVVVGVSGGADSCCLLHCLHCLGYELVVGHLDHQLRPESAEEAQYVKKLGQTMNVQTFIGEEDVRSISEDGFSLEEASRIARYQFLLEVANKVGARKIATGHTADDQIETVLMHILQGTGTSGLRGMLPLTRLETWTYLDNPEAMELIRPLLCVRRSQTETYCAQSGIKTMQDSSNQDLNFLRNRIRHELIPYLLEYNPRIDEALLRLAWISEGEASFLDSFLEERWKDLITYEDHGSVRFGREAFEEIPVPIKRIFLRRIILKLAPDAREVGFDHIENAIRFLVSKQTSGKYPFPSGMELVLLYDEAAIYRIGERVLFGQFPQMEYIDKQTLAPPVILPLAQGWKLIGTKLKAEDFLQNKLLTSLDQKVAAIDSRKIMGKLTLRTPLPGDRFTPLGMKGNIKLSDFFINNKIPSPAREFWPLLCDEVGIVWVTGLRISNRVRISPETTELVTFQVDPPKEVGK